MRQDLKKGSGDNSGHSNNEIHEDVEVKTESYIVFTKFISGMGMVLYNMKWMVEEMVTESVHCCAFNETCTSYGCMNCKLERQKTRTEE